MATFREYIASLGAAGAVPEAELDEQALRDAINATGYQAGRVDKEPWQKKGLFGRR